MKLDVRILTVVLRCCVATAMFPGAEAWGASTLYVSPGGDDAAAGRVGAPLRTLGAGIRKARTVAKPVRIELAGGRYEPEETIRLGPQDSKLVVEGAAAARPVISGGTRLTGWVPDTRRPGVWQVTLPAVQKGDWYFHQLFVDGVRAQRARTPNSDFFRTTERLGTNTLIELPFQAGDIRAEWAALPDARLVMLMKWTDLQVPIRSVDVARNVAVLPGGPRAYWMDERQARYWVENVPDALDMPGEWYLERGTGVLSYWAPAGVDPNRAVVVAPRLRTLLQVAGEVAAKEAVTGIAFRGLSFAETDYETSADGMISPQAAVPVPGAVLVTHAVDGVFQDCAFENLGGYALELGRGAQRWQVQRCEIRGSGAGGIRIGEPGERHPDDFTACRGHQITDNRLHQLGRIFAPAVGVIVFQSGQNRIAHNEIHDLYYTAVSVGWNWGYQETPCRENVIEFNHLHHIGQGRLSDMGGVYTLGIQKGTVVRNNLIHDVTSYDYGGWGLYPDEGSTGILLESNVVYRCKSSGFHQHYGRENVVRYNVFAFNRENQLMRTRDEDHLSFYFTNNIVYFDSGRLLGSSWKNDRYVIDGNLYYDVRAGGDPGKMEFSGATWEAWRKRGHDRTSVIVDPQFVDAARMDFRLKAGSPALERGFRVPDLSGVGPRR